MQKGNSIYAEEAERIADYLIGVAPGERELNIYSEAMQILNIQFTKYEQELWKSMLKSKWRMACIDGGLALKEPNNNARRKLFCMLSILETSPAYIDYFLSKSFSSFYFFKIMWTATRAVCRGLTGLFLIKLIKIKCK